MPRRHDRDDYDTPDSGRSGGYSEDAGQGGGFGDRQGHSEIGRRGGQMRHERAMRAPRDEEGRAEDAGQGGWFGDTERHADIARRGGEIRHERATRARHDLEEPPDRGYRGSERRRYDR